MLPLPPLHPSLPTLPPEGNLKLKKSLKANMQFGTASNVRVLNVGHAVSAGQGAALTCSLCSGGSASSGVVKQKLPS